MINIKKNQQEVLSKLGIEKLNPMQEEAITVIRSNASIVLLSPTGTGKTLAFLLPLLQELDPEIGEVQVLILVPSRELAIQIEQVTREMGSGYKANAVYGGRAIAKDKTELSHPPTILIGTPGRVADHFRRGTFSTEQIKYLVLDEFDKSLEVGFESEMREIIVNLPFVSKKILTSATSAIEIPQFAKVENPAVINYLKKADSKLQIKFIDSFRNNKVDILITLLKGNENKAGIVFCNFRNSIGEVSEQLNKRKVSHGCFYGGMEQKDRERSLIKFRNGSYKTLLATDLAARGIDIPELDFIIHYELPLKEEEFIHRNGRTARMNKEGVAYVIKDEKKSLPEYIGEGTPVEFLNPHGSGDKKIVSPWTTLFISGGRKDKISKGDIAGLFLKQGNLEKDELGNIELKQDCAFVAVPLNKSKEIISALDNSRLKKKKVRIKPA